MQKIEAQKMTKAQLADLLADLLPGRHNGIVGGNRARRVQALLDNKKPYLVAKAVFYTTPKTSPDYAEALAAFQTAAKIASGMPSPLKGRR